MAIIIKTKEQIEKLRVAGKIHAEILKKLEAFAEPGMSTKDLDREAERLVRMMGAEPAFLAYRPEPTYPPYPASLCVSVNQVVVHGIPSEEEILKEGDIVSIDFGVKYQGVYTDAARTFFLANVSQKAKQLIFDTYEALDHGIAAAQLGNTIGDIGYAVESFNHGRYGNVRELAGHGVGVEIHEDPYVPNYGKPGQGAVLREGMVLAIEPMFTLGSSAVHFHDDFYTVSTSDGSLSAHVEDTILITKDGPEILTR